MKVGIVGAGFIAEAMVDGFLSKGPQGLAIVLSPRGAEVAARLAGRHPDSVSIARGNQDVLDATDIVILAVRPQVMEEVVAALRFQAHHHVVSLVAGYSRAAVAKLAAPAGQVTLAMPLPAMARGLGPTVVLPPNQEVSALFSRGGLTIEIEDEQVYAALGTTTAIMAPYFAMAKTVADWLARRGVAEEAARLYVAQLLAGLAATTSENPEKDFGRLERDHATPGSFNDQLRTHLREAGAFEALSSGLDGLLERMIQPRSK